MKASFSTVSSLLVLLLVSQTSHAKYIMCWQNKQNIRECGGNVPPEYAQQRIEVLNERGIVVKIIQARKTKAQLAEEARETKHRKAKEERRRQDMILLKTFTREEDLLASRDKQLAAIDSIITIANGNLKVLNSSLAQLQKQAADHERSGTNIPNILLKDISTVKSQINENDKYLKDKQQRKKEINQKFANDLKRYRKLKEIKPR